MTEEASAGQPADAKARKVEVREGKTFSIVWIVPLVALVLAGGLLTRSYLEKGPTISLTFKTADGLEAGKTKIMYRSVEVGLVDTVELGDEGALVRVTATVEKNAAKHLTTATQFWVVRPRIGVGGISGLGTLISGAYIEMDPAPGTPTKTFTGLEVPPLTRAGEKGLKLVLEARQLGSINFGSPIYYREIHVGEVTGYRLDENQHKVDIDVFIKHPHENLVRESTRFWNTSGIEVSLDAEGFEVRTASIESLLAGGISFETLDPESSKPVEDGAVFKLFRDYESSQEKKVEDALTYVLYFEGSVRGLSVGAPVDFRGIPIGEVKQVKLEYDKETRNVRIPVLVEVYPQNLTDLKPREAVATLVEHGMRAKLQTGNLLTGQLFVELELHPEVPIRLVADEDSRYPELPTMPSSLEGMLANVSDIVKEVGALPLAKLVDDLTELLEGADKVLKRVDSEMSPLVTNVNKTLEQLQGTLETADGVIAADSPVMVDLADLLEELSSAARSVRVLSAYLERHPEALIYGKGGSGGR